MAIKECIVFSIALEGYSQLFKPCIRSHKEYCSKFGYEYVLVNQTPRRLLPTEAAWLKIFLLREALNSGYDWVGFIDADCEIRSHAPAFIKEFSRIGDNKKIFLANGFSGRINSGVIFLNSSNQALNYLNKVIKNGDQPVPKEDRAPYENGHMITYGKNNEDIKIIDSKKWNNNSSIDPDSYIQHYSGGPLRKVYLNEHDNLKFWFKQRKRLLNLKNRFKPQKKGTSMREIEDLLKFYRKKYPQLTTP